jgi:predicted TIM-barrel fold metal-dependent hydrolase
MPQIDEIRQLVDATPFVDTHEHLLNESTRLAKEAAKDTDRYPADFSLLFIHYSDADLVSAGMPEADRERFLKPDVPLDEKWALFEPYYERTRHTGYLLAAREACKALYGEDDFRADNIEAISEKVAALMQPGYFKGVLHDVANVEHAQVNSFEDIVFNQTDQPDLTCQDLSFVAMSTGVSPESVAELSQRADIPVSSLNDFHQVIDWVYAEYGPRAIAVKNQSAYQRRLDYTEVSAAYAGPLFERYLQNPNHLPPVDRKALEDHLFHYCVDKSAEYNLPVKLHTGYYAGWGGMPLHRVRKNAGDMCEILKAHPNAKFVIMHITYPYNDEAITLAKHYPNAYIDMCWAWIMNPAVGVRFVKEYLMAAPANKILTFGGDYGPVELVPGHAAVARQGIAQALRELIAESWLDSQHLEALVHRIMCGNAHELFDYDGTLANWQTAGVK